MNDEAQQRPGAALRAEHQVILRVVGALEKLMDRFERTGEFANSPLGQCVEFFRLFADACHHGKEEELLFPALEAHGIPREGGPIGVMLYEHGVGRRLTREMGEALVDARGGEGQGRTRFLSAARQYVDLLRNHILKEDNVLFVLADRVLPAKEQDTLAAKFCTVNCRAFEGKRREELERLADQLESV